MKTVKLKGTAAEMIRAFEVKLDRYEFEGHQYRARSGGIIFRDRPAFDAGIVLTGAQT